MPWRLGRASSLPLHLHCDTRWWSRSATSAYWCCLVKFAWYLLHVQAYTSLLKPFLFSLSCLFYSSTNNTPLWVILKKKKTKLFIIHVLHIIWYSGKEKSRRQHKSWAYKRWTKNRTFSTFSLSSAPCLHDRNTHTQTHINIMRLPFRSTNLTPLKTHQHSPPNTNLCRTSVSFHRLFVYRGIINRFDFSLI